MIRRMEKVRVLGPGDKLLDVLAALQDLGTLHFIEPDVESPLLEPGNLTPAEKRECRYLGSAIEDADRVLAVVRPSSGTLAPVELRTRSDVAREARRVRRLRCGVEPLAARRTELTEERALLLRYRELFSTYQSLFEERSPEAPGRSTYCLVLRDTREKVIGRLRAMLEEAAGEDLQMSARTAPSGETAVVLSAPPSLAESIERAFTRAGVHEVPLPPSYGGRSVAEAVPKLLARLENIPSELEALYDELGELGRREGARLLGARAAFHDRLSRLETLPRTRRTPHAFVLDGWVPESERTGLEAELEACLEGKLALERLGGADLADASAPVALENPKLFRPFEALVKFLPLPHYGTIDPTPFVAVFFPMFFGLILGDVGYGLLLALLAWILHRKAEPDGLVDSLAKVAGASAAFTLLFGLLYGELFGDLGHELFGMPSLWFRREEALLPFLGLALALGFVHILLGLLLGVFGALRRHRREALGRGVAAAMIVLILLALLAAAEVLPEAFFTPSIVALLVAFPVLVVAEGLLAPIELLASVSNIFSYARIMAIGTASVMMAVVANRMVGEVGSVVVGVIFALLFHLVNFVLGVFSPTIHALRLHYVEFFGKFYRPGGAGYDPFRHWGSGADPARK